MRHASLSLIPVVLALTTCASLAQTRQAPPPLGAPKPFTVPAGETFTLNNGLGVTLVPYGTIPKVTISLAVDAANADETASQVWLADLTGQLIKEGTTTLSAEALAERLAQMGGSLGVGVGLDTTTIGTDVLSEYAADAVTVIADVAQRPALPDGELARLKGDLARQLSLQRSQPGTLAAEQFRKTLYGEHPYGRVLPTDAMLAAYTIADVKAFHRSQFGAGRAHLYVVGRFDAPAVRAAVTRAFDGWQRGTPPTRATPRPVTARSLHLIDRPGAPQSTLYIGRPVVPPTHADYIALRVTNALLGGSFASRITSNIREQKGYTYSPNSQLTTHPGVAHWVEIADVTTAVTGASIKEILFEIDRLGKEAPPAEELDGIKNYLAGVFVLQNSSRGGIVGQLEFLRLHGLGADYLGTLVQKIRAVTPEEVRRVAATHLASGPMAMVVVGDTSAVAAQVEEWKRAGR